MSRFTSLALARFQQQARTVEWRFAVDDAREKLVRLYPKIELEK